MTQVTKSIVSRLLKIGRPAALALSIAFILTVVWATGLALTLRDLETDRRTFASESGLAGDVTRWDQILPVRGCKDFQEFELAIELYLRNTPGKGAQPVIIYLPGWGAVNADNDRMLRQLATHGYAIIALRDIKTWPLSSTIDPAIRKAVASQFDLSTFLNRAEFKGIADRRVAIAAKAASCFLDNIRSNWKEFVSEFNLDSTRFGLVGFSFGGAVAAELAQTRTDVAATANLDGWLYGQAYDAKFLKNFLWLHSTALPFSPPDALSGLAASRHYLVSLETEMQMRATKWAQRDDVHNVYLEGASHEDFSDELLTRARWKDWRPWRGLPMRTRDVAAITDAYLAEFFQINLSRATAQSEDPAIGLLTSQKPVFRRTRRTWRPEATSGFQANAVSHP